MENELRRLVNFVLYRHIRGTVEFARLLYDSRDLARHLPAAFKIES